MAGESGEGAGCEEVGAQRLFSSTPQVKPSCGSFLVLSHPGVLWL